jgi:hypothetical protein
MSHPNWALAERNVPQATIDWPEHAQPYAVAPAQYGPAHHYGVVHPHYAVAAPPHGAPAQGYGARRRPGTVIAAAVVAFVVGGLGTLVSLLFLLVLVGLSVSAHRDAAVLHAQLFAPLVAILFGILLLVLAKSALFIWGGVRALKGRKTMLMVVSTIQLVLTVLALVSNLTIGMTAPGPTLVRALSGLVFVVPILILLQLRSSREFFRARRGGMT